MSLLLAVSVVTAPGAAAVGFIIEIERGHEVNTLNVSMRSATEGVVLLRECDDCPETVLRVTDATLVYKAGREVELARLQRLNGQAGVVFREIDSDRITRIKIY